MLRVSDATLSFLPLVLPPLEMSSFSALLRRLLQHFDLVLVSWNLRA